jgi:hypothetical protein
MKRTMITLAAVLAALVPAAIGLWGNASFSQAVPVRVPASAQVVTPTVPVTAATSGAPTADDHGGDTPRDQRTEPGDDRDNRSATSTSTPSGTRTTEAGDDHGGGDSSGPGSGGSDDHSGSSGSGRSGSDDSGADDHGGHGSDD